MIIATHQSDWIKNSSIQTIRIDLFLPLQQQTNEWGCRVNIDGIENFDKTIYGEDSVQSIELALKLARAIVGRFVSGGWRLTERFEDGCIDQYDEKKTEEYLDAFF